MGMDYRELLDEAAEIVADAATRWPAEDPWREAAGRWLLRTSQLAPGASDHQVEILEDAWALVANANKGGWPPPGDPWRERAERWRGEWHAALKRLAEHDEIAIEEREERERPKRRPGCPNWLHGLKGWSDRPCPFECSNPDFYRALDGFCALHGITLPELGWKLPVANIPTIRAEEVLGEEGAALAAAEYRAIKKQAETEMEAPSAEEEVSEEEAADAIEGEYHRYIEQVAAALGVRATSAPDVVDAARRTRRDLGEAKAELDRLGGELAKAGFLADGPLIDGLERLLAAFRSDRASGPFLAGMRTAARLACRDCNVGDPIRRERGGGVVWIHAGDTIVAGCVAGSIWDAIGSEK